MEKIERLTDAQIARFPEFVKKWKEIGLCTDPADRAQAERGIRLAYAAANLQPPLKIVWTGSPLAQGITRALVMQGKNSVWASVGGSVRGSVRDSVRNSVGVSVRDSVRDLVWASVWNSVRGPVGGLVWGSVGVSVGDSVRASVRGLVLDSVRDLAGDSVRGSVGDSGYGQHDAAWLVIYDYFREVCGLTIQTDPLAGLTLLAQSSGWYLPHERICWVSERHRRVCLNARGQLHSHDGMAVEYPDGWGVWAWNGVRVNEQIILTPDSLTPEQIAKEKNAQVRQVMVERIGIERICQLFKAQVAEKRGTYELLILDLGDGRKRPYLKMLNPSIGVWHVEGVDPRVRTVQEALNFRNGLTPEQIDDIDGADWYQQGDVILRPQGSTRFKSQPIQLT